jgi:putative hydrolase of the HAD superfamily
MKYQAIVFDYAGVVAGDTATKFDESISKIIDVSVKNYKEIYYRHNDLHNTGKITWDELWKRVLTDLNKVSLLDDVLIFTRKPKKVNKNVIKLIRELKNKGYKVALLSNYSREGGRRMRQVLHLDKVFDLMLISGEIGLAKPHPEVFLYLIKKLNVSPSEIIFIDDSPKNIKTANSLGITTVLCEDPKTIRSLLKKKDVL